jgi:hypothetical protein
MCGSTSCRVTRHCLQGEQCIITISFPRPRRAWHITVLVDALLTTFWDKRRTPPFTVNSVAVTFVAGLRTKVEPAVGLYFQQQTAGSVPRRDKSLCYDAVLPIVFYITTMHYLAHVFPPFPLASITSVLSLRNWVNACCGLQVWHGHGY